MRGSKPSEEPISRSRLAEQLETLGVERGGVLLVHTSYREVRPVEGGPEGLIEALRDVLGADGTLVTPSWPASGDEPFHPDVSAVAPDLGVVPDLFWRLPGVQRSTHPAAFAAAGPRADFLLQDDLPLPPHVPASPVGRVHELDGQILLLGVNHDANTTIHLAECMAEVPYGLPKHCTVFRDGHFVRIEYRENDHCCARFRLVDDWLRREGFQSQGPVGHAVGRLVRSQDVTRVVVCELSRDPLLFLHREGVGCGECDEARRSCRAPWGGPFA
jgi:aminoglycoside 3-N-acetyltransferase-4